MLAAANSRGQAVLPRGGGTKLHWGNPPARTDAVELSTLGLNQILEHAASDMTVTVEAGCTVAALQTALSQQGQRLAVDPLWPEQATVGGILATNDSGALRLRFGGLRDLVIGITVALADGTLASSGGKVVKNVAGYDLPKLMTGALGTLGVITQAVFRLHPLPAHTLTLKISCESLGEAQALLLAIQDSQLAHSALQLRVDDEEGDVARLDILFEGTQAGIAAQRAVLEQIAGSAAVDQAAAEVWGARQRLWPVPKDAAVAKISVLPSELAWTCELVRSVAGEDWTIAAYGTGIGYVRLRKGCALARKALEERGRSLVMLSEAALEAWGEPGDALAVMRALKHEFDPSGTLNPGRFVGGI